MPAPAPLPLMPEVPLPLIPEVPLPLIPEVPLPLIPEVPLPLMPEVPLPLIPEVPLPLIPEVPLPLIPEVPLPLIPEVPLPLMPLTNTKPWLAGCIPEMLNFAPTEGENVPCDMADVRSTRTPFITTCPMDDCALSTRPERKISRRASDVRSARLNRSGSDGAVRPRDAEDCYGVTNHEPIEHFRSNSLPQDECRAISGIDTFNRTDYKQLRATSANPCRARSSLPWPKRPRQRLKL